MNLHIPFNRPHLTGDEAGYMIEAHTRGQLAGDGYFTRLCSDWLTSQTGANRVLLTTSATSALDMTAILAGIHPGDEIIMPSFTFVSTANAFVLRGGVPVFVDIRPDTLNLDERRIESAITSRTKAIVAVHYAGVSCEMDTILDIARRHQLLVIEDAAQGLLASYRGTPLGAIGDMACYSFHETKNVMCGEGGALLLRDPAVADRAEIVREKGTDRSRFFRGQVDRYTWVDIGSSLLPGELNASFLWAQLQHASDITARRLMIWQRYYDAFEELEFRGVLRRPIVPPECEQNGHLFFVLTNSLNERTRFIEFMEGRGIGCVFHYVPLHSSPKGLECGRVVGDLSTTEMVGERLVRFPLWIGVEEFQEEIIESTYHFFNLSSTVASIQ
jgi:dTDP-4-amino-4,6-dideoxygalactose transaminase